MRVLPALWQQPSNPVWPNMAEAATCARKEIPDRGTLPLAKSSYDAPPASLRLRNSERDEYAASGYFPPALRADEYSHGTQQSRPILASKGQELSHLGCRTPCEKRTFGVFGSRGGVADHIRSPPASSLERVRVGAWVTKWVSRHVVATCFRLLNDLPATCDPCFRPKNAA